MRCSSQLPCLSLLLLIADTDGFLHSRVLSTPRHFALNPGLFAEPQNGADGTVDRPDRENWQDVDVAETVMRAVREGNAPSAVALPDIDVATDLEVGKTAQFGVWGGIDDPRDAPWRLKAEGLIRESVEELPGVELYDITWNIADLQVVIDSTEATDSSILDLSDVVAVNRAILDALEPYEDDLNILGRHELEVSTRGAPDVLRTEREFEAFKGFDVVVSFTVPDGTKQREPLEGKLVSRDVHETAINVKGRTVRIPNYLCAEVRLPAALEEQDGSDERAKKAKQSKRSTRKKKR